MLIATRGRQFATELSVRAARLWALALPASLLLTGPCLGYYSRFSTIFEGYAAFLFTSLVAFRTDLSILKILDAQPLRWLGGASCSYYVLHMASVPAALAIAGAVIPQAWSASFPLLVGLLVIPLWLLALVPLAMGSFHIIEVPGIKLGRRLMRRWGFESPTAARPAIELPVLRRAA